MVATARRRSRRRSSPRDVPHSVPLRSRPRSNRVGILRSRRGSISSSWLAGRGIRRRTAYSVEASRARARPHARPPVRVREGERVYSRTNAESRPCGDSVRVVVVRASLPRSVSVRVYVPLCRVRGTGVAVRSARVYTFSEEAERRMRYAVRSFRRRHRHRHRELLRDCERSARESCARRDGHARRGERAIPRALRARFLRAREKLERANELESERGWN